MTPEQKREYMREWRANNPEKLKEYGRNWRENNREFIRMQDRKYYAVNPQSYRIRQKEYQLKTLDKFAERSAKWDAKNHEGCLLRAARCRASKRGLEFNIEISDILIPDTCPILGISIVRGKGKLSPGSATLDRINNDLGYVKGNVWVISSKANLMKNSATLDELVAFGKWAISLSHKL